MAFFLPARFLGRWARPGRSRDHAPVCPILGTHSCESKPHCPRCRISLHTTPQPAGDCEEEKKRLGPTAHCCCCVRSTSNINTFTLTAVISTSQPPLAHLWGYRASRDALFARIDTAGAAAIQVPRCRQTRSAAASDACLCASRHHLAPLPLRRPVRYSATGGFAINAGGQRCIVRHRHLAVVGSTQAWVCAHHVGATKDAIFEGSTTHSCFGAR